MSEAGFKAMAERLRERRALQADTPPPVAVRDETFARSPDGVPCWFIPASAIAERLEQLHPRGAA